MDRQASPSLEELLSHAGWARRLARGLVSDPSAAEDTVQDALLTAVERPPADSGGLRAWLRQVLTHRRINRALSDQRREAREQAVVASEMAGSPPSPEELTAAVELQRLLAGFVLALPEPFRRVLVLRYYQDLSAAEISRMLKLPAGTVRWRLKEGLGRLRERLDRERGGPEAWRAALIPTATAAARRAPHLRWPLRPFLPAPVLPLVLGASVVAGGALWLWAARPSPPRLERAAEREPLATVAAPAAANDPDRSVKPNDPEVDTMKTQELKRVAAFLGVGLPALVASAARSAAPLDAESIEVCVMVPDKSAECKEQLMDAWLDLRKPPAKHRAAMRQKMLEEISAGASAPKEARRQECAKGTWSEELIASVRECIVLPDCGARAACMAKLTVEGVFREVGPSSEKRRQGQPVSTPSKDP